MFMHRYGWSKRPLLPRGISDYDSPRCEAGTWGEVSMVRVRVRIAVRGLGEAFASEVVFPDPLAVVGGMVDGPADAGVLVPDAFKVSLDGAHGDAELPGDRLVRRAVTDRHQDLPFAG